LTAPDLQESGGIGHFRSGMLMSFSSGLSPGDIPQGKPAPTPQPSGSILTAHEFAEHLRASSRVMWLIAVGIIGDPNAAEDVIQDAAMVAMRKLDQFQRGTSFRSWVGAIVRNVALNAVRGDRRRRSSLGEWTAQNESMMTQDDDFDRTSASGMPDARIVAALADIGDVPRACLLLRTVGNLQYAEIATLLEIPEGTAMSHVHRARAHWRQRLAGVWEEKGGGGATQK